MAPPRWKALLKVKFEEVIVKPGPEPKKIYPNK
jgi:hypothetical protein